MRPPEYRVRLFLSVDLTGSTAYKHEKKHSLLWIKAFKTFYETFPNLLRKHYSETAQEDRHLFSIERENGFPRLWKTVGDEILFCCTLTSLCHLGVCIDAFIKTLIDYGKIAKTYNLDTKGNAWVASFPTPNCSIKPIKSFSGQNENSLPTEDDEIEVDEDPSKFDFLGKGIDAGFRISRNSGINALTISPGLGILLCECKELKSISNFDTDIRLISVQEFKGVAKNNLYPVITIDTFRDDSYKKIIDQQRDLLGQNPEQDFKKLRDYLTDYLKYFKIEIPKVKKLYGDKKFTLPDFYDSYIEIWNEEFKGIQQEDEQIESSSNIQEENIRTSTGAQNALKKLESSIPDLPQ